MGAADAPACLLPNGNVICVVGAQTPHPNTGPIRFFEYDGRNLNEVAGPTWLVDSTPNNLTYAARLLVLPSGEILFGHKSATMGVYAPTSGPLSDCGPVITSCPSTLRWGETGVRLEGQRLNGVSQGAMYGDDTAMATNYPLVRIQSHHGKVMYCGTHHHSTMGISVRGDTLPSFTTFDLPNPSAALLTEFLGPQPPPPPPRQGAPPVQSSAATAANLVVVANGIASAPMPVVIR